MSAQPENHRFSAAPVEQVFVQLYSSITGLTIFLPTPPFYPINSRQAPLKSNSDRCAFSCGYFWPVLKIFHLSTINHLNFNR